MAGSYTPMGPSRIPSDCGHSFSFKSNTIDERNNLYPVKLETKTTRSELNIKEA